MIRLTTITLLSLVFTSISAQASYWQQRAEYEMEIDFDVKKHQFEGVQRITYQNNSPDTLHQVFYHLYFNAFQPGSMMDVRSRSIADPDARIGARIAALSSSQQGYHQINSLKQDGQNTQFEVVHTILEVELAQPILPGQQSVFEMEFSSQVPIQIRRSGRQNAEGIAYSMSQWYPKLCEYDRHGWHANPYVSREFYGVWGDFDVKITIDSSYTIGGTGYLQNPEEIGHGYQNGRETVTQDNPRLTWHFKAPNVHDFVWAADPDYKHVIKKTAFGVDLHFFYQDQDSVQRTNWEKLPEKVVRMLKYFNEHFGKYPYKQYSVIQGGDGGMEYPMATLITGKRKLGSLVGVTCHEMAHSWYQGLLGSNESMHSWMDEGFTEYASNQAYHFAMWPNRKIVDHLHKGSYTNYFLLKKFGVDEPLTTHADHFNTNKTYGANAYSKGEIFLVQLEYIVGKKTLSKALKRYFREWAFKHPDPFDFIRIVERVSGMQLDWYLNLWVGTTKSIDYAIEEAIDDEKGVKLILRNYGQFPMPIDLQVTLKDGRKLNFNIPLTVLRSAKATDERYENLTTLPDWPWTHPAYNFQLLGISKDDIALVEIDPSQRLADVNRENNKTDFEEKKGWRLFKKKKS